MLPLSGFQNSDAIEAALNSAEISVRSLYTIWEQRQPVPEQSPTKTVRSGQSAPRQIPWLQSSLPLAGRFIQRALEKQEFLLVCDGAEETLRLRPWESAGQAERTELVRIGMNYAAALTRLGFTVEARSKLEAYVRADLQSGPGRQLQRELFLQLGEILREEVHRASTTAARRQKAAEALGFYQRGLALAPTDLMALLLTASASLYVAEPGSALLEQAHGQARQALRLIRDLVNREGPRFHTTGGRALAQAILGAVDEAAASYHELQGMEGVTTDFLAGARYNARFIAEALGKSRDFFRSAFPPLELLVFAGHMPDLPGSPRRFPPELIEPVREMIRNELRQRGARVGLVCASAGADLIFARELHKLGGEVHLVLPWSREEFRQSSIRPYEPARPAAPYWEPLFGQALENSATIRELGQAYSPTSDLGWQYMMEVTAGLALQAARVARLDVKPIALWDGRPGRGVAGTAAFVEFWKHQLQEKELIVLTMPGQTEGPVPIPKPANPRVERATMHQQVKSMLFADIVGYSKLTENVIPEFIELFMGKVSQLAASSKHAPRNISTWGDAVYAVFDFAHDAGCFALELTGMIQDGEDEWLRKGLSWNLLSGEGQPQPQPLNIRVGLHTGPVFIHYNPVTRQLGFTGAHVNRAARIEPIAKPGQVYASEEFAALSELDHEIQRRPGEGPNGRRRDGFLCEYAGTMALAKNYPGRFRIYRVMPKRQLFLEELAQAAHELYCQKERIKGHTPETNSSLRPWEQLSEDLKESNRAQVADIPTKLAILGYEMAPGHGLRPSEIVITPEQLESLAMHEHERWRKDRRSNGWSYAPTRDASRKHHPLLVPWEQLSKDDQDKDREAVLNLSKFLEMAGVRVRKK